MAPPMPSMPPSTPEFLAEDIGPALVATASIFIVLSTLFVGLRYYARHLTNTKWGVEDIITPFALIAEIGLCITAILMVKKAGAGRHMAYVAAEDPLQINEYFKGILVQEILHLPAVAFPKLCVLALYLKVFTNKSARIATWVVVYLVAGTWIGYTIAACFQCRPFRFNWDKSIEGVCFNVSVFSLSSSVPNIVTDVAIIFLPIRTIVDLKVSMGKRIGLFLIFMTGSVGIVASIIRTAVFAKNNANIMALLDVTYTYVELVHWTIIEPGLYLMAACALSFKPLFRMLAHALHLDSLLTHTRSRNKSGTMNAKTGTMQSGLHSGLHMDTLKSSAHKGFKKIGEDGGQIGRGRDGRDEEQDVGVGSGKEFNIVVTTTVDMDVESRSEEEYDLGDRDRERDMMKRRDVGV